MYSSASGRLALFGIKFSYYESLYTNITQYINLKNDVHVINNRGI